MSVDRPRPSALTLALTALVVALAAPAMATTITIVNVDPAGVGFNDPTPVAPVGGNPGTTLGQQRLNAFQHAASVWASTLDSTVEIRVQASNPQLACTPTSAVLGSAGAIQIAANFPGAPQTDTWHHIALANKLAGFDLIPGPPGTNADDIVAFFNRRIDDDPNCLVGATWYYGLDHDPPGDDIDYVRVVLHELGHGLGFSTFVSLPTGQHAGAQAFPDVFEKCIFDNTQGLFWDQMSNAQRAASATNCSNVVWDCPQVTAFAPFFLDAGSPELTVDSPPAIAGTYSLGAASFGPALTSPGVSGEVELVDDGVGATADGCEPLIGFTAGNIALIDRGTCAFTVKVANAQAAGAVAALIADNVGGCPPAGLGGSDPAITIPSGRITLADGNLIKAQLPGVDATVGLDPAQLAGADDAGRVKLYTPDPLAPGSSVSHWDPSAFPDLLMEPFITPGTDDLDLTPMQMADIGWMLIQSCGNGVREGLELCDGGDLFGQTCQSLGFSGGALACAATCDAFDTSACVVCDGGPAEGRWNLPAGAQLGAAAGKLSDANGQGIYSLAASLVPTAPGAGQFVGIITDSNVGPPDFYVDGTYQHGAALGGVFSSKIFAFGTGASVGRIEGRWEDDPLFTVTGVFSARWEICQ